MAESLEKRKEILEVSKDLNLMILYRKAILDKLPMAWVFIHNDSLSNNYGLEINNSVGGQCSVTETELVKEIIRSCKNESIPVTKKKAKKKKDVS